MLARSLSRVVSLRVRVANRIMVSSLGLPSLHARKFPTALVDASFSTKESCCSIIEGRQAAWDLLCRKGDARVVGHYLVVALPSFPGGDSVRGASDAQTANELFAIRFAAVCVAAMDLHHAHQIFVIQHILLLRC